MASNSSNFETDEFQLSISQPISIIKFSFLFTWFNLIPEFFVAPRSFWEQLGHLTKTSNLSLVFWAITFQQICFAHCRVQFDEYMFQVYPLPCWSAELVRVCFDSSCFRYLLYGWLALSTSTAMTAISSISLLKILTSRSKHLWNFHFTPYFSLFPKFYF